MLIAGAGPVGLWLAAELRLHGVEVTVVERRAAPDGRSRAVGMQAGTLDTFATRGLAERFIERGTPVPTRPLRRGDHPAGLLHRRGGAPLHAGARSVRHRTALGGARGRRGRPGAARGGGRLAHPGAGRRRDGDPGRRHPPDRAGPLGGGLRRHPQCGAPGGRHRLPRSGHHPDRVARRRRTRRSAHCAARRHRAGRFVPGGPDRRRRPPTGGALHGHHAPRHRRTADPGGGARADPRTAGTGPGHPQTPGGSRATSPTT